MAENNVCKPGHVVELSFKFCTDCCNY
jgi:hypothetical protein